MSLNRLIVRAGAGPLPDPETFNLSQSFEPRTPLNVIQQFKCD
jgi:hypothetical protein